MGISSSETCNGPRRHVGSLFAITGSATGPTELQLGLDWGRGGFSLLALAGFGPQIERYNTDIWWRRDWEHRDVLNFFIPQTDNFLLVGLGFEGCCDGDNSARWRSLGSGLIGLRTLNEEPPGEWQTLAVNDVPEPGVLPLLGLGLMGLVYARRQSAGCPCRI